MHAVRKTKGGRRENRSKCQIYTPVLFSRSTADALRVKSSISGDTAGTLCTINKTTVQTTGALMTSYCRQGGVRIPALYSQWVPVGL